MIYNVSNYGLVCHEVLLFKTSRIGIFHDNMDRREEGET